MAQGEKKEKEKRSSKKTNVFRHLMCGSFLDIFLEKK
jgi:hypothetical protein